MSEILFNSSAVGFFLYFLYPASLISISIYVSHKKEMTSESYFFANRNTHWFVLAVSFLTTSLFTIYILGLSSPGLLLFYGLISVFILYFLRKFLVPIYLKTKINTLPQYFEKRFNRSCKVFLSALYILYNVFIRLVIILIIGSILINKITGTDSYSSLLFLLIITGIYVIIGGLRAEFLVNIIQALLLLIGAAVFFGWIIYSNEISAAIGKSSFLTDYLTKIDPEFTWPGFYIGIPIITFWFWCADQFMIQKLLSSGNIYSARKATLATVLLLIIPVFILTGINALGILGGSVQGEASGLLSYALFPENLKAALTIAISTVLVTSLASLFNSTSSLVTLDFYRSFKPAASDRKLVLVGRLTTMTLLFISILLIPLAQGAGFSFWIKLFKSLCYFASLVTGVFIIALLNQKISGATALLTLITGTGVIMIRTFLEIFLNSNPGNNILITWFIKSRFLEFSVFIFFLSILLLFVFNKLEWMQDALSSFLKVLKANILKVKL